MTGFIKLESKNPDNGARCTLSCETPLEGVNMFDKAALLNTFLQALKIDDDELEVLIMLRKALRTERREKVRGDES